MPNFGEFLFGSQGKNKKFETLIPEQREALVELLQNGIGGNSLYQQGNNFLQNLLSGGPNAYSEFNAPYLQQFQQQIVPGLSERFAGMGTGAGGLSSSGFNQTIAQAGTGLQAQLAQLRNQLALQAAPQALQYSQQPFSNNLNALGVRAFENAYKPGNKGIFNTIGSEGGQGIGAGLQGLFSSLGQQSPESGSPGGSNIPSLALGAAGTALGGPLGGVAGSALGSLFSGIFGG